jgi:hypothetical protein
MGDLSGPESIFIAGALHAKRKFPSNQFVAHDSNRNGDLLSIEISIGRQSVLVVCLHRPKAYAFGETRSSQRCQIETIRLYQNWPM